MAAFIRFRYRTLEREVGHHAGINNRQHLKEILERYGLEPRDLTDIYINGKPTTPAQLQKMLGE